MIRVRWPLSHAGINIVHYYLLFKYFCRNEVPALGVAESQGRMFVLLSFFVQFIAEFCNSLVI